MKTTVSILLLAAAAWAQEVAVPQGGSLGPSCKLSDVATLGADKLDGSHGSGTPAANSVPVADSNGKLAPGWIPLPTGSSIGGIFMSADCLAGNHVNGIDPASGQLKCAADAADWSNVGNKPSAFPPDTASQAWQDLVAAVGLKAPLANAALSGTTTAEQIVAATSVQVGSGIPAVNFSYGTSAPTGACTAGMYWRQVSADTVSEFYCNAGSWTASGAGGGANWGSIAGTLASQTDLQAALNARMPLTGGTMSGTLVLGGTPSGTNDAANKGYVDTQFANALPSSYLSTDGTLAANSDTKVASQKATKTYADTKLASSALDSTLIVSKFGGGTCSGYLKSDGTCATPTGISGLTTGTFPKAATGTSLGDSALSEDASNVNSAKPLAISGNSKIENITETTPVLAAAGKGAESWNSATHRPAYSYDAGAAKDVAFVGDAVTAAQLPKPTISSLGGVQAKDCSGTGHVQKINTDGSITCSADSGVAGSDWISAPATTHDNDTGTYNNDVTLTVGGCAGGSKYYSSNGTTVSPYSTPLSITVTGTTVKSRCELASYSPSAAKSSTYTLQGATPTFSADTGAAQDVTISKTTTGGKICYTSDGSTPGASTPGTCNSSPTTEYTAPVHITASTLFKAITTKANYVNSLVGQQQYTIGGGGGGGTWALVQSAHMTSWCPANTNPCTISNANSTLTDIGAGHVLAILVTSQENNSISATSGGGTSVHCPHCQIFGSARTLDASYILSSSAVSAATGVAVTLANAPNGGTWGINLLEYSLTGATPAYDTSDTLAASASASPVGVDLTGTNPNGRGISGTNDLIIQWQYPIGGSCTAISAPFTNPAETNYTQFCVGGSINTASGAAPTYTQGSSATSKEAAIAFKTQ
ncbi:MAG TPA: chitobiase/beta-hexosaminidase C-terminal domain-containing protein [Terriglobales bacterium]|nr:chitobiase/beta-hexosaminidase C-terminal domain-containing protein [Terriglobales bacterium]